MSASREKRLRDERRYQPGSTFARSAPQRSVPVQARDTGPDARTRAAAYLRDGYACVCCGTPIEGSPHSLGHRKRRSQGGTNGLSNLLTFLGLGVNPLDPDDHHARIDSRRDPHDEARGYSVRRKDDPRLVGVMYLDESGGGVTRWLDDNGDLNDEPPGGEAA